MDGRKTVKVTRHNQVTIPADIAMSLGIHEGDLLSVEARDGNIILSKLADDLPRIRVGRKIDRNLEKLIQESIMEVAG
jgi:AbrB family looped-hinge helix DNA binding protein